MQVSPSHSTISSCHSHAKPLPSQGLSPQISTRWKEIVFLAFNKLKEDASQGYQQMGNLWKQTQILQPIKIALTTLIPSRFSSPVPAVEFLKDDPQITCKTLKNGFTYYLRHNEFPFKNQAYIQLVVKTGYLNEKKEELGIAHLVEHLLQIRTSNYGKGEIDKYFSSKGILWGTGDNNASTSHKETCYYIEIPVQDPEILDKTLHIFSEMAFHAELLDQYVQHEKEIVCDELRQRQTTTSRYQSLFFPLLQKGAPYKQFGSTDEIENIKKCSPQTARDFYKKWYQPQNMSLTVVGDIDPEKVSPLIEKHFGSAQIGSSRSPDHHYKLYPPAQPEIVCFSDKGVPLSQGEIYYKLPPTPIEQKTSVNKIKQQLTDEFLKVIINRRLSEMLSYPDNSFIDVGVSMPYITLGNPSFRIAFSAKEGSLTQSFKALLIELKRFKEHGIHPNEFSSAEKSIRGALSHHAEEKDTTTSSTFADICEAHFNKSASLIHPDTVIEAKAKMLSEITIESLNARLQYLLQHDQCVVGIVQPEKQGLQPVTEADLKKAIQEVKKEPVSRYEYIPVEKPLLARLPQPGKIIDTTKYPVSGITKYTLENGVVVYAKPTTFLNDSISLYAHAIRGKRDTEIKDRLSAKFCERFFDACGIGEFSLTELKKALAGKTVAFSSSIGNYITKIKSSASKKDLETSFQLIHTMFTNPGYSRQAFDSALTQLKEMLNNKSRVPHLRLSEEVNRINTQDHPEYQPFTVADLEKIDYELCKKIHKDFYSNASDFSFFIVGNYSETELIRFIEQYLGSLSTTGEKRERLSYPEIPFPKGITYKQVEGDQHMVNSTNVLTFPAAIEDSELEISLSEFCTQLITERLIKNLRLKLGITYTPRCVFSEASIPGLSKSFPSTSTILFTGDPNNIKDLEEATIKELRDFQAYGPTEQEIQDCKTAIKKKLDKVFKTNKGWLTYIAERVLWKGELNQVKTEQDLLETFTPAMIQEHSKKLYPLDNYTMVSLLPIDKKQSN